MNLCKLFHHWVRLPEPNRFGFSLRICKRCKTIQRPSGGYFGGWFTITQYREQYLNEFIKQGIIKEDKE